MFKLQLQSVPSQTITASVGGNRYTLIIKDAGGFMTSSISRDGETITNGSRIVYGTPLINIRYLQNGDFILDMNDSGDDAKYQQFEKSQFLYYVTQEEINGLR